MNHPSFYLSLASGNAIDIQSARTRARLAGIDDYSIEASRGRGSQSQRYSVICSASVAEMLMSELAAAQGSEDLRNSCDRAIADIRAAMETCDTIPAAASVPAGLRAHTAPPIGM